MSKRQLYRDVVNEGLDPDFEEALLQRTVSTARRVRRTRTALRSGLVALVVLTASFVFWPRQERVVVKSAPPAATVASYQPIATTPFNNIIRTEPSVSVLEGSIKVAVISTSDEFALPPRLINDEELLDLFKGHSVALVSKGGEAQLILLDQVHN